MLRSGKSIKHIAPAVGYTNVEAFSRTFAKRVGQAPADWLAKRAMAPAINVPYRVE